MNKFDNAVIALASESCSEAHGLPRPCPACLISAARADERFVTLVDVQTARPVEADRTTMMRRLRMAGHRITEIMGRFGASYGEVMTALHATSMESVRPVVTRRPIVPMFSAVAA